MNELSSTKVKNLRMDDDVSMTSAIIEYVDGKIGGDTLSAKNIIATENIKNGNSSIVQSPAFAGGYNSQTGCHGYRVLAKDDEQRKITLESINGLNVGMTYSMFAKISNIALSSQYIYGNRDFVGAIIEVIPEENAIVVDKIWQGNLQLTADLSNDCSYLWFPYEYKLSGGTVPLGECAEAFGYRCVASQIGAHAEGCNTFATGKYAHAEGYGTVAGYAAHAENTNTQALGQHSHAEGHATIAYSNSSHAEGRSTYSYGYGSHAEGSQTSAGYYSHAEGQNTVASGFNSHAAGISANAIDDYSFAWNGNLSDAYVSHGKGSFNVNPKNGTDKFFIGEKNVIQHVNDILPSDIDLVCKIVDTSCSSYSQYAEMPINYNEYIYNKTGELLSTNGTNYRYTDYILVDDIISLSATYSTHWSVAGWALYDKDYKPIFDENDNLIGGYYLSGGANPYDRTNEIFTQESIKSYNARAKYIRFSGRPNVPFSIAYHKYNGTTIPQLIDEKIANADISSSEVISAINNEISSIENQILSVENEISDMSLSVKSTNAFIDSTDDIYSLEQNIFPNRNAFINKNGQLTPYSNYYYSDFLPLSRIRSLTATYTYQWSVVGWALYDKDQNPLFDSNNKLIGEYNANDSLPQVIVTDRAFTYDDIKLSCQDAEYIRFSSLNSATYPLKIYATYSLSLPQTLSINFQNFDNTYQALKDSACWKTYAFEPVTKTYITKNTGVSATYGNAIATDYIEVNPYTFNVFKATGAFKWGSACLYAGYDISCNTLFTRCPAIDPSIVYTDEIVDVDELLTEYPSLKYLRFSSFTDVSGYTLEIKKLSFNNDAQNVLFNKRYVACGDSFSAQNGTIVPYPLLISDRNNMKLKNASVSGTRMCVYPNDDLSNLNKSFAYTLINNVSSELSTADYITFAYGINEQGADVTYGDESSTDLSTIWGAYNTSLSTIFTWNPIAKVGMIISDGINSTMRSNLSAIARWWGLPILDLANDPQIPPMTFGRNDMNPFIVHIRNSAFRKSSTDSHPNQNAQNFRSTIIEDFLRSM